MQPVPGLRRMRLQRCMTVADLEAASGVSHNTIWRLEVQSKPAWPRTIKRLAAALNVEPAELLEG